MCEIPSFSRTVLMKCVRPLLDRLLTQSRALSPESTVCAQTFCWCSAAALNGFGPREYRKAAAFVEIYLLKPVSLLKATWRVLGSRHLWS